MTDHSDQSLRDLRRSESYLKNIVENSADGLITIDGQSRIETVNPAACRIFGYQPEQLVGQPVETLLPEKYRAEHRGYVAHSNLHAARIIDRPREFFGLHSSGRLFPIELTVSRMATEDGVHYLGIVRDISELAEERAARERALEEAERASLAKSRLLAAVSHELRTPLNAIVGFSELLLNDFTPPLNETARGYIHDILQSGEILRVLVDDILDVNRIESGVLSIRQESVQVRILVDECLRACEPLAKKLNLRLSNHLAADLWVSADRTRLKQVLLNVLSNAIKYNVAGGYVEVSLASRGQGRCVLAVADSGAGLDDQFSADTLSSEPFPAVGTGEIEGSGIGLVLSRRLLSAMQGELRYRPNQPQGSIFYIELPLAEVAGLSPDNGDASEQSPAEAVHSDLAGTVLYIEDNPVNIRVMQAIFSSMPLDLACAESAEEGLDWLQSHSANLILMDINLPGMSGYEALQQLQGDARYRHIPVIAVSAAATAEDDERALRAGFCQAVSKPFNIEKIRACVFQVLTDYRNQSG